MKIGLRRKGDYAVRAVLHLARHYGQRRKAKDIADDMAIPEKYLPQILSVLIRSGVVVSTAGPVGGYELARNPRSVSLIDVVEAVEGPLQSEECVLRGGPCRWEDACAVHDAFAKAQDQFRVELGATTFAELAAIDAEMSSREDASTSAAG